MLTLVRETGKREKRNTGEAEVKDDETTYSRKVITMDALSHALNVGIKGDRLRVKLSSYAANVIIERFARVFLFTIEFFTPVV